MFQMTLTSVVYAVIIKLLFRKLFLARLTDDDQHNVLLRSVCMRVLSASLFESILPMHIQTTHLLIIM